MFICMLVGREIFGMKKSGAWVKKVGKHWVSAFGDAAKIVELAPTVLDVNRDFCGGGIDKIYKYQSRL